VGNYSDSSFQDDDDDEEYNEQFDNYYSGEDGG
jgi:hypothetical protein